LGEGGGQKGGRDGSKKKKKKKNLAIISIMVIKRVGPTSTKERIVKFCFTSIGEKRGRTQL